MKQLKKIVSLLLVITLALSIACMPAAASNQYNIRKYVALGDSIATGMNEEKGPPKLPTGEVDENGEPVMGKTVGSNDIGYTANVAKQLDLIEGSGYVSYAYPGLRAHDIRYMLDEAFAAENDGTVPEVGPSFDDLRGQLMRDLKQADLVTLNVGENDVFTWPIILAVVAALAAEAETPEELEQIADAQVAVENAETPEDALSGIRDALKAAKLINKLSLLIVTFCTVGYQNFRENFPEVLKRLREINPDVQIVVLGMFNPAVALLKNDVLSALDGLDAIVTPMNAFIASSCLKYGCEFIPMTDMQIDSTMHPSVSGYRDIANRIVSRLKTQTSFSDVSNLSDEFKTAINWAVEQGIAKGTSATMFSPNDVCTRAQIVTFLWRIAGMPAPAEAAAFTDLTQDWYKDAVAWASENGITNGTSADKFSPDQTCTRAQIVTFLYRYDQKFNPDAQQSVLGGTSFRDVSPAAYYGAPVAWAVKNGITKGTSAFLFAPLAGCTRAQAVTFLYRYAAL